jgi:hypothetical protein
VAVLTGAIADRLEVVAPVRRLMTEADAAANALGVVLPQPMEKPRHGRQIDATAGPTLGSRFNSRQGCPNVKATATAKTCCRTQEG